jgi:hypothetical protein
MLTNCLVFDFINHMEQLSGYFENKVCMVSHLRRVDQPEMSSPMVIAKSAVEDSRCPKIGSPPLKPNLRVLRHQIMRGFH